MKTALIVANGIKQIMLSPETDEEKAILSLITPRDEITVDVKQGTLYDSNHIPPSAAGYLVAECQSGYLRAYEQKEAVMLVLRPKAKEQL